MILSVRDTPAAWAESWLVVASFGQIFRDAPFRWLGSVQDMLPILDMVDYVHTGGHPDKYNHVPTLEAAYEAHVDEVKRMIPTDRLLVFNVKDGWGPLCDFLGKPVPSKDTAFPHVNDRVVMSAIIATFWAIVYAFRLTPFVWIWVVWRVVKRRRVRTKAD